ncbi:MAG: murein biosynthesis integral membrane protein MurJ, partial [Clostridia bacterium]|nr:murein biosynthesis integral membrane protein MurJ [Clostridia bacterium]
MNDGKEKKNGLLGTAAVMAVIILLAKLLGLLRDILVAHTYGTTDAAIAYETASRLPILIFDFVIGGVVSAAFIPVFSELLVREGKPSAIRYAAAYLNLILALTGVMTVLGILFAGPLVGWLAPDLAPEVHDLAVRLSRILFPMILCTGIAYSFVGILQSLGEFRIPALISLVSNCIMVGYLALVGDRFGITGLAAAMLIGWAAQVAVQLPRVFSLGFRPALSTPGVSAPILRSLRMALPILIGTWTQPICAVVNTRFASAMEEGRAITALGYANRLYTILVGIFSFVATNLLFPYFSRSNAEGDRRESRRLMRVSARTLVFIIAPIAVGLVLLAEPILSILFERGEFTAADTALTAAALRCYAVGMLFMAVNEVLTKAFFAEGR